MSVLSDRWIKKMALEKEMIKPFISEQKRGKIISYGLSSFGYDARVSDEFKIFTDVDSAVVDPKILKNNSFVSRKVDECIIPPNSFALASTVEYFKIPKDILVICLGKSTYARCGIIVNVTPLNQVGKVMLPLNFQIQHHYLQKFMPMKELLNLFFLKGK